jgi:hypothetical protein
MFTKYDEYIQKIVFYQRRIWTCEFSGAQGLTYEQALAGEAEASVWIEKFPTSHLKALLERAQFSTRKLDDLVNETHKHFSENFVAGEELDALDGENVARVRIVRKIQSRVVHDDEMEMEMDESNYEVEWLDQPDRIDRICPEEAIMRPSKIVANKTLIRNALKAATTRGSYGGAPFEVRTEFAETYGINMEVPYDLKRQRDDYLRKRKLVEEGEAPAKKIKGESDADRKEREKLERKAAREEERRRRKEDEANRIKYPIEDDLLLHSTKLKLPSTLAAHWSMPPELAGLALSVWCTVNTFSSSWGIFPFSFEDFDQAVHYNGRCNLVNEVYVGLLRVAIESCQVIIEAQKKSHAASDSASLLAGFDADVDSNWVSEESILGVDLQSLRASEDTWESVLKNFLQFQTQSAVTQRLVLKRSREDSKASMEAISRAWDIGSPRAGVEEAQPDAEEQAEVEPDEDPISMADLQKFLLNLLELLGNSVDDSGEFMEGPRIRAELFLELPDPEVYPDYYKMVKDPIAINTMQQKVLDAKVSHQKRNHTTVCGLTFDARVSMRRWMIFAKTGRFS